MDKILEYIPLTLAIIGGITVIMSAVAPLTKNKYDDKAVGWLSTIANFLKGFAHNKTQPKGE